MEIKYVVQSCSEDEVPVVATVAGREVSAKVAGLVVELLSEDGGMGHTFRLTPTDMAAATEFFAVGEEIKLTFSKAE
jgi:hypothetical protein